MPKNSSIAKKSNLLKWLRRLIQFGLLGVLGQWSYYGIFRCPFPVPFVSCTYCPVITCHGRIVSLFWGFWVLLPISLVLFGRMFCAWACPAGLVIQMLGKIAPIKMRAKTALNRFAHWGKYVALCIAIYLWPYMHNPRWAVPIRTSDEIWTPLKLTFAHAGDLWLVRTYIILGLLALGFVVANLFCRYACPMGGTLEGLKKISFFNVYKTEVCDDCDKCLEVCEMGTRPEEANCTNCCDCLHMCPVNAIRVGRKESAA